MDTKLKFITYDPPALAVDNLTVKRRQGAKVRTQLEEVSFSVPRDKYTFIVGRSGIGKSLTILAILGLLSYDEWELAGTIWTCEPDGQKKIILKDGVYQQEMLNQVRGGGISALFQEPSSHLHPSLDIRHQIFEALPEMPVHEKELKALDVLESVGINGRMALGAYPHQFAQGERQRICMAIALAPGGFLIADEPTASVDPARRHEIVSLFKNLRRRKIISAMLIVTHQKELIRNLILPGDIIVGMDTIKDRTCSSSNEITVWCDDRQDIEDIHPCFIFNADFNSWDEKKSCRRVKKNKTSIPELYGNDITTVDEEQTADKKPTGTSDDIEHEEQPLLEVKGLKQLLRRNIISRPFTVLENINMKVSIGEMVGLIGSSGSGKTTLAKAIVRLLNNTEGKVDFKLVSNEVPINLVDIQQNGLVSDTPQMHQLRRRIQYISQEAAMAFNPALRMRDILNETLDMTDIKDDIRRNKTLKSWLRETGLLYSDNGFDELLSRFPFELSGGEKQRFNLLRSFLLEPDLIITDEPFANQDLQTASELVSIMRRFQKENGIAFLLISHDHCLIHKICNRVYQLDNHGCLSLLKAQGNMN